MRANRAVTVVLAVALVWLAGCSNSGAASQAATDDGQGVTSGSEPAADEPADASSAADSDADDAATADAPSVDSPAGTTGAIMLHVKVAFTSPFAITDSYDWTFDPSSYAENDDSSPVPATCADLAKLGTQSGGDGNPPTFQTPTPPGEGAMSSGKNSLMLQAYVDAYAGPGTYTGADVDGAAGMELSNTPELPADDDGGLLFSDVEQTSSITVNADGSGVTTIAGWQDAGGRSASGTLTWTCSA